MLNRELCVSQKSQQSWWFPPAIPSCSGEGIKLVVGSKQVGALLHMHIHIRNNGMRELRCLEGTSCKDG